MWESWRVYISFALVGAIFILSQALSGGTPGNPAEAVSNDPGDRSYREVLRDETSGRGDEAKQSPPRRVLGAGGAQTD